MQENKTDFLKKQGSVNNLKENTKSKSQQNLITINKNNQVKLKASANFKKVSEQYNENSEIIKNKSDRMQNNDHDQSNQNKQSIITNNSVSTSYSIIPKFSTYEPSSRSANSSRNSSNSGNITFSENLKKENQKNLYN